jgi:hypothetical protein
MNILRGRSAGWIRRVSAVSVNEIQEARKEGRKMIHGIYTPVAIGHHYSRVVASGEYSLGLEGRNLHAWRSGARYALGTRSTRTEPKRKQVMISGTPSAISGTAFDSLESTEGVLAGVRLPETEPICAR